MLTDTLRRLDGIDHLGAPVVVASAHHRHQIAALLDDPTSLVIAEPVGRNTAPAVAAAAIALSGDHDPVLLVLPADHVILDTSAFHSAVARAARLAAEGRLVTFGVVPTRAETGYGYIQCGPDVDGVMAMVRFVEKPDAATAERYVASRSYLWNSGMFVFRASTYLAALRRFAPDIVNAVENAVDQGTTEDGMLTLADEPFRACRSDSIDFAVMEHMTEAAVVPLDAGWNDVGSWAALWDLADHDEDGNAVVGDVVVSGATGSYLRSDHRLLAVADVANLVVVETRDAVLVVPRHESQRVRDLVDQLDDDGRPETTVAVSEPHRWGTRHRISTTDRHAVERLVVDAGSRFVLEPTPGRADTWVVVDGHGTAAGRPLSSGDRIPTRDGAVALTASAEAPMVIVGILVDVPDDAERRS